MACHNGLVIAQRGATYHNVQYPDGLVVPCGKCVQCKKRRIQDWVFRMKQEDKISSSAFFITLTYDNEHIPKSKNGFDTLKQKDFQNFMKALRKLTPNKLRYYACGEYGETFWRPHYHLILFNLCDPQLLAKAWTHKDTKKLRGKIHVGQVTGASISYVTSYINKTGKIPTSHDDDRLKEFSNMSQGIGQNYLTPEIKKYHQADINRLYATEPNGKKISLPRYYRKQLFTDEQIIKQNEYIVLKMNEIELQDIYEFEHKFKRQIQKDDYSYWTYKQSKVNGEIEQFYHQSKIRH